MTALFVAANVLIAVDYALLGIFFLRRIRFPTRLGVVNRVTVATVGAALFFFGCVHTHLDLLLLGHLDAHWFSWPNVLSHILQGVGGFMFWFLAQRYLVVNIFERRTYEVAADPEAERRLQYLAQKAGLVR